MKQEQNLSVKQKLFADAYLDNGRNASAAYRATYGDDKPEANINSMSSRLLRSVKVQDYLVKVMRKNLEKTATKQDIDRSFLIGQYLELVELGKQYKQISSARQALDSLAHISGLWLDKRTVEVSGAVNHLASLDTSALLDALGTARRNDGTTDGTIDGEYRNVNDE